MHFYAFPTFLAGYCRSAAAIGKRNTWEKDGATVTMLQIVVGAVIAAIVVVSMLVFLAILVVGFIYEWMKGALEWE